MSKEPNVLPPTGSDLHPTPDERVEIEKIIGPWECHDAESDAHIHRYIRRRVLRAFRAGYAVREETLEEAYARGYAEAEAEIGEFECDHD